MFHWSQETLFCSHYFGCHLRAWKESACSVTWDICCLWPWFYQIWIDSFSDISSIIDIPEEISESWYHGMHLMLHVHEVSVYVQEIHSMQICYFCIGISLFCMLCYYDYLCIGHVLMCELHNVFSTNSDFSSKPIVFICSDGGPDHRLAYVQLNLLICIFLKLDLDYLCACRTASYHSWKNPVERVMSDLSLQCVGVSTARGAWTRGQKVQYSIRTVS